MTVREAAETVLTLSCVVLAVVLLVWAITSRSAAPSASCASLYRLAHTASDSLTVAVSRGDCAP